MSSPPRSFVRYSKLSERPQTPGALSASSLRHRAAGRRGARPERAGGDASDPRTDCAYPSLGEAGFQPPTGGIRPVNQSFRSRGDREHPRHRRCRRALRPRRPRRCRAEELGSVHLPRKETPRKDCPEASATIAFVRTADGFLTSVHDVRPGAPANLSLRSVLRVAQHVERALPAGATCNLSALELEGGLEAGSRLGDGHGKWQLLVSAGRPVEVMSLMVTRSGHISNLSTWRAPDPRRRGLR